MICRECSRPLWDGTPSHALCEGCLERSEINQSLNDVEFENRHYQLKRNHGELTGRRLTDLSKGY
jgi:hypothetical protein